MQLACIWGLRTGSSRGALTVLELIWRAEASRGRVNIDSGVDSVLEVRGSVDLEAHSMVVVSSLGIIRKPQPRLLRLMRSTG